MCTRQRTWLGRRPPRHTLLALIVELKTGFKTGWFQPCFDVLVFLIASLVLEPSRLLHSLVGAIVLNLTIAWNFTIDRGRNSAGSPVKSCKKRFKRGVHCRRPDQVPAP